MTTRTWLSVLLIVMSVASLHGQENRYDIGLEGGPSRTFLRGNTILDKYHQPTLGFSGGMFFQFNFKKIISLRTNLSFERKGSVMHVPLTDINGSLISNVSAYSNFNYLTVPLLVRATFGNNVRYFMNVGPYWGYLLKQTFVIKGDKIPGTTTDNTSLDKRSDIGVTAGMGISVLLGKVLLVSLEARHNTGFYDVSAVPVVNDGAIKTNSTNILLGVAYRFGQRASPSE